MNKFNTTLSEEDKKRLDEETNQLVWIPKINKDREYQANLILEKMEEIYQELDTTENVEDFYQKVFDYIRKEHLFISK